MKALVFVCVLVVFLGVQGGAFGQVEGDITWMADYFPGFADEHTVGLWLFDEVEYSLNTLTDAGIYEYDLRLFEGKLPRGKYGTALKTVPGSQYNVYYAEWMGKVCKERMRRPKGEPSGVWGPTVAPKMILAALGGGDWTIEFWFKGLSKPDGQAVIIDMGHAYDPGFKIGLDAGGGGFRIENVYAGYRVVCPTDAGKLLDGKWRHVAFTWSKSDRQMKHYLDGKGWSCEIQKPLFPGLTVPYSRKRVPRKYPF